MFSIARVFNDRAGHEKAKKAAKNKWLQSNEETEGVGCITLKDSTSLHTPSLGLWLQTPKESDLSFGEDKPEWRNW